MLKADGFGDCFIGVANMNDGRKLAIYCREKCIKQLMASNKLSEAEADDFFEFNVAGAYLGSETPIFLDRPGDWKACSDVGVIAYKNEKNENEENEENEENKENEENEENKENERTLLWPKEKYEDIDWKAVDKSLGFEEEEEEEENEEKNKENEEKKYLLLFDKMTDELLRLEMGIDRCLERLERLAEYEYGTADREGDEAGEALQIHLSNLISASNRLAGLKMGMFSMFSQTALAGCGGNCNCVESEE